MEGTTLCSEAPDQLCSVKDPSLAWHSSTDQFLVTEGRGRPLPAPPHTPAPLTYLQSPKGSALSAFEQAAPPAWICLPGWSAPLAKTAPWPSQPLLYAPGPLHFPSWV